MLHNLSVLGVGKFHFCFDQKAEKLKKPTKNIISKTKEKHPSSFGELHLGTEKQP